MYEENFAVAILDVAVGQSSASGKRLPGPAVCADQNERPVLSGVLAARADWDQVERGTVAADFALFHRHGGSPSQGAPYGYAIGEDDRGHVMRATGSPRDTRRLRRFIVLVGRGY